MRKQWSAALLATIGGTAAAQSSVTLYGIVDTGVQYYNHAAPSGSLVGMPSLTGELPSRFGLKGNEDLGGGNKAFFVLENGFATDTGGFNNGGRIFGRAANVGFSGMYGTLTLGRQMNMSMVALSNADVIGPSIHSMASFDTYLPNARSDNAIGYLGQFAGVTVGGTYSFGRDAAGPAGPSATNCGGEVAGNALACRQYTALLAYDGASFGVAGSYDVMRGGAGASAPLTSSAYTDTRTILDGYVKFSAGKLGIGWVRRNTSAAEHSQSNLVFVGGTYYLRPALSVDAQVSRYVLRDHGSATLLVGRVNYAFSRRTTVYTSIGYMLNSAQMSTPVAAGGTVGTGLNQAGAMVGVQHRF